jgi:hypothetical protein
LLAKDRDCAAKKSFATRRTICSAARVARIRTYKHAGYIRVKVTGRLTAGDLGRLEHACAPALTTETILLDIDVSGVTESDETATLFVRRMGTRGARIVRSITTGHDHAPASDRDVH